MVSELPPCRQCGGRFGRLTVPPYCGLCGQLAQLTTHLYSRRFPQALVPVAEEAVREALHKCLAASDCYWGAEEARRSFEELQKEKAEDTKPEVSKTEVKVEVPSPKREVEEAAKESRSSGGLPGLSGKAASPCRPVSPPRGEGEKKVEKEVSLEREESPKQENTPEPRDEKRKSSRRKRHRRTRSHSHRSRSRRRRREGGVRERSISPRSEEDRRSPGQGRGRVRPSSYRGAPAEGLQERDYSGYYQQPNWTGPIPAGGSRRQSPLRNKSPKQGANKGVKKRKQQERARAWGGWNNRGGRGWKRR